MENGPVEDVFPIENGDIPASYVSLPEGSVWELAHKVRCCFVIPEDIKLICLASEKMEIVLLRFTGCFSFHQLSSQLL